MSDKGDCRTAPATPGLLINHKGVCRTAPATPGLLNTVSIIGRNKGYTVKYSPVPQEVTRASPKELPNARGYLTA